MHFNAVRLMINHMAVIRNNAIPTETLNQFRNPELFSTDDGHGISYIQMLERTVEAAAKRNVLVLIAVHRLTPESWPGNG